MPSTPSSESGKTPHEPVGDGAPQRSSIPTSDLPDVLHVIVDALANGRNDEAAESMQGIAFQKREAPKRRSPRAKDLAAIYDRDRYLCRYCGTKTVLTPVMHLLSKAFPEQFPFHPNWKTTETHPAYWALSATHDHVVPISRGGDSLDHSNIVTACWPCNTRKSGLLIEDIGFVLREPEESPWRGLADLYRPLWAASGRPLRVRVS